MNLHFAAGSTIGATYTVLERLGEGAFSEVFLVRHRFLGLQAMKLFKPNSVNSAAGDQFSEAFILSKLAHPNVVRIYEANKINTPEGDRCYVTMEYISGGTLQKFLSKNASLPLEIAVTLQAQICAGLAAAHSQKPPIVHRDVKPANVLVSGSPDDVVLKVADFGLAKSIDPRLRMASAAGTLLYFPPEAFHHYETPASDVYSAGLVFYEMLTARFPFPVQEWSDEQQFRLHLARTRSVTPPAPSTVRSELPTEVDAVCLKALDPDIRKRFQSAGEFSEALEGLQQSRVHESRDQSVKRSNAEASAKAEKALEIGCQYAALPQAIELLEEAISEDHGLKERYENVLAKWKSGIVL
jgi:eukaryotic-like serine/threonine-protein kinase